MRVVEVFLCVWILCCIFSASGYAQLCKKLKVPSATAQELIPGTAQQDRSTEYKFQIKVKGNKEVAIKSVCLKHEDAVKAMRFSVMDASGSSTVSTLQKGDSYQILTNSQKDARGENTCDSFEGVALITYTYGGKAYTTRVKSVEPLEAATRR